MKCDRSNQRQVYSTDDYQRSPSEFEVSKGDYYRALPISEDNDFEFHLKKQPNSCFVNNCFIVSLNNWQVNMDMRQ